MSNQAFGRMQLSITFSFEKKYIASMHAMTVKNDYFVIFLVYIYFFMFFYKKHKKFWQ